MAAKSSAEVTRRLTLQSPQGRIALATKGSERAGHRDPPQSSEGWSREFGPNVRQRSLASL